MGSRVKGQRMERRKAIRRFRRLKWIGAAGALGLVIYAVAQMPSFAYTDRDISVVDFSLLTRQQRNTALESANRARCTCGCGMTLAQCVATDSTCPIREGNIDRIKDMVAEARE